MYNHILYLSYWITNSLVLFFLSKFLGSMVVLGNTRFNEVEAAVYAGFWMTFILWVFWDFAIARQIKFDKKVGMFMFFFCVNFFAVWTISRFSHFIGFEQVQYWGVFVIAIVATLVQRIVRGIVVSKSVR